MIFLIRVQKTKNMCTLLLENLKKKLKHQWKIFHHSLLGENTIEIFHQ
jgi:hypothetical protein